MNRNSAVPVVIGMGGTGVVAHAGSHALMVFADRLEVPALLSEQIAWTGERAPGHDRGVVLVHGMAMLAGGGEACSDIERLRAQPGLFGPVASDSTVHRVFHQLDAATRDRLWSAMATVRARVWDQAAATAGGEVVLDIDASLHEIHSEHKEGTAPHYKGGFGFHPIYCFADATGEALAVELRPGNAGANSIADHLTVLDRAIAGLPSTARAGHGVGDDPALVARGVRIRTDSAGCTDLINHCRARNVGFSVITRRSNTIHAAISRVAYDNDSWQQALTQAGEPRDGAAVIELTHLVDLSGKPTGTRLIVRREPLHQGAQGSLFESATYRYWGFWTDQPGTPVELDVDMRGHARVEDNIRRLKDSGGHRFPFTDLAANRAWLDLVCFADTLVRWFQLLCLTGLLARAEPKTLRWRLWHTPARIVRSARRVHLRILDGWPTASDLFAAHASIPTLA